tara:strand:+ start:1056 stop:4913 length:3858 start_codon:yes stop_codon:yes gene_type:complete
MAKTVKKVKDTLEEGLTINVPESYYKKPFVKRMLDPASPTIEVDGEEASVRTMSMDGKLFPTIVKQELSDGSFGLVELEPQQAYDRAIATGNFIQFDSDEQADRSSKLLSEEASALRKEYKNNQNFIAQGGKGLGDLEFRADVEPYSGDDALNRLALELFRRGEIELKGITQDQGERPGGGVIGGYAGRDFSRLNDVLKRGVRDQNPLTKEKIMSSPSLATYIAGVSEDSDTTFDRPRGESELAALHELRHGALRYLFNNTDLKKQKYFDNYDIDVEEDIMDMTDNKTIKDRNIPIKMNEVSKLNPKYIGGKDRFDTITKYATQALEDFNVPKRTEQKKPGMLQSLFGMEQGGIMMAQQGKMPLPMEEATSAPQGGGPKAANPAAKPAGLGAPTGAPAPAGSSDPRDAAFKEVSQKMQKRSAPTPAPIPETVPQMVPPVPPTGSITPTEEIPMLAKGGMPDDGGMSVMIGLGAPPADYEEAAEGNPPPGATKEEVADDQLVLLSEGELVVPANVVRYHGLGAYEGMRRDALMGLQDMETNGQIEYVSGGAEKADKVDDDGGIIKANQGAFITNPNLNNIGTFPLTPPTGRFLQGTSAVAPQAASQQFVTLPTTSKSSNSLVNPATGLAIPNTSILNPLSLPDPNKPYTPVTDASSVYAPNRNSYAASGPQECADGFTYNYVTQQCEETSSTSPAVTDPSDAITRPDSSGMSEGGDGADEAGRPGGTAVFGGTSNNGLLSGHSTYGFGYESSKPNAMPGLMGMLTTDYDQVRLTDYDKTDMYGKPQTAVISRETYDAMTKDRTNPAHVGFIDSVMTAQQAVDYDVNVARNSPNYDVGRAIKDISSQVLGTKGFGPTKAENQAAAQAIAKDMGIPYKSQSLAEMIALDLSSNPSASAAPAAPSVQGAIPDELGSYPSGMNSMASAPTTGLRASEVAAGAGQFGVPGQYSYSNDFTGRPAQPVDVNSFTGPYTQPTRDTASAIVDRQMQAAGLSPSTSNELGISTSPTATQGVSQLGDYGQGISTSPTATQGISQIGNYGTASGFNSPTGMVDDFGNRPGTPTSSGTQVAGTNVPSSTRAGTGTVSGVSASRGPGTPAGMVDDIGNRGIDTTSAGYTRGPETHGMEPAQAAAQRAENRANANAAAQAQTGNPNSSAVTDSHGNAIGTTGGGVVTGGTNEDNQKGGEQGAGSCVIATHGVMTGGFSVMEKAKAELWCQKTYHGKWYGEAFRKGYKAAGQKHVSAGTAPSVYQEFKDFVAYGRGVKKGWKLGINYYWRTFTFFITGLFLK